MKPNSFSAHLRSVLLMSLLFICTLSSCTDEYDPGPLTAQAVVAQRASRESVWNAALVPFGENINTATLTRTRGFWQDYNSPITEGQPFALILETEDWDGRLDILMKISHTDTKVITILDSLELREVYIHPNGNPTAAQEMANSITFPANILILPSQ